MLFNSFEFLLFLPVVFLLHWLVLKGRMARNLLLAGASYIFYGWWNPMFLLLIFFTTVCSYLSGILIGGYGFTLRRRRAVLWINVLLNLGILGVYKYFDFFSQSFAAMMSAVGWQVDAVTLNLILPVGISFYTFQALSYSIDVYRGDVAPTRDFVAFVTFISFFPQLVAGPIERATNLLPQFLHRRSFSYPDGVEGMKLMLWGLFKKMVVADNAAPVVNSIFGNYTHLGSATLWVGALLFTFQIYCDFSGYSDIAVGVARLFGVRLMRNFRLPYFSKSINDFWKRWHISLTSWFRDYVYIPLGGNRKGRGRTLRNTLAVFTVSGLWHGADFTFIVWGLYHGLLYLPHIFLKGRGASGGGNGWWPLYFRNSLMMGLTFLLVVVGWVLFRADHLADAIGYVRMMFSFIPDTGPLPGKTALCWALLMMVVEWHTRHRATPFDFAGTGLLRWRWARWGVCLLAFAVTLLFAGIPGKFIYFQF